MAGLAHLPAGRAAAPEFGRCPARICHVPQRHWICARLQRKFSGYFISRVPKANPRQTIAALLLLNLPTPTDAFIALANVLNRPLPLSFYASDAGAKNSAYNLVLHTLSQKSPALHQHLTKLTADRDPDAYLEPVFAGLFTQHLALDEATRMWDVYVFEGDPLLVRAGVALLLQREMALLGTRSVADVQAVLGTAVLDGSSAALMPPKSPRVVGGNGEDDRWMKALREAGKA